MARGVAPGGVMLELAPVGADGEMLRAPSIVGSGLPASPARHVPGRSAPSALAVDPVELAVTKSWDGQRWQINLSWTGGVAPYTVSYATDATFQAGVRTLQKGFAQTGTALPDDTARDLEVYAVTAESSTVSPSVEAIGYDPIPLPTTPTSGTNSGWWGDTVTLSANYLDPISKGNIAIIWDQPVRALAAEAGGEFATWASFVIPDDARGFVPTVQAHGRSSPLTPQPPFYSLLAKTDQIGVFTNIHGITFAPQNGRLWVAADGAVDEVDLFQRTPTSRQFGAGFTKPYISRVTNDGRILAVDGTDGVAEVLQITVGESPVVAHYAFTHDDEFTRNIRPVGIAADPDGSACYVADASTGRVVKIPASAGTGATIRDAWGGRTFVFPDPAGIDGGAGHQVAVAGNYGSTGGYIYLLLGESSWGYSGWSGRNIHSIEIDRDSSTAASQKLFYTTETGIAEVFNHNPIGANPARHHGGVAFGMASGRIALDPDWFFAASRREPSRVVLNDLGRTASYPSRFQPEDRIIELRVTGWPNVPMRLRVIDPPDLAPYAPDGGWAPEGSRALPYEGNDNKGTTDFGLSTTLSGPWTSPLCVWPAADNWATAYLKVPAQYSGDNFQVELTKCQPGDPPSCTPIPNRIAGLSTLFTSWKRVFIERDRMFRKGGLLFEDYDPAQCEPNCSRIEVYDWNNAAAGDTILVFDEPSSEGTPEQRAVTAIGPGSQSFTRYLSLDAPLTRTILASSFTIDTVVYPNFRNLRSAGYGTISACDSSPNQVNASDSCFFDADMRALEPLYSDAFVEILGRRFGVDSVPYLGPGVLRMDDDITRGLFSRVWFMNGAPTGEPPDKTMFPQNYFHIIGAGDNMDLSSGYADAESDQAYVMTGWIIANPQYGDLAPYVRMATGHELGHLFDTTNSCSWNGHDTNRAWCGMSEPIACFSDPPGYEPCVMWEDKSDPVLWSLLVSNDINRFCCSNLFGPIAADHCGNAPCAGDEGIRNASDPQ